MYFRTTVLLLSITTAALTLAAPLPSIELGPFAPGYVTKMVVYTDVLLWSVCPRPVWCAWVIQ